MHIPLVLERSWPLGTNLKVLVCKTYVESIAALTKCHYKNDCIHHWWEFDEQKNEFSRYIFNWYLVEKTLCSPIIFNPLIVKLSTEMFVEH